MMSMRGVFKEIIWRDQKYILFGNRNLGLLLNPDDWWECKGAVSNSQILIDGEEAGHLKERFLRSEKTIAKYGKRKARPRKYDALLKRFYGTLPPESQRKALISGLLNKLNPQMRKYLK